MCFPRLLHPYFLYMFTHGTTIVKIMTMIAVGSLVNSIHRPTPLAKEVARPITIPANRMPFIAKKIVLMKLTKMNFLENIFIVMRAWDNLKNLVIPKHAAAMEIAYVDKNNE